MGHSYGGGVALLLAARRPTLVAGLVLVGSVGRSDSIGAFDRVLALPGVGEAMTVAGLVTLGRAPAADAPVGRRAAPGELRARLAAALPDEGFLEVAAVPGPLGVAIVVAEQRFLLREIALVEDAIDHVSVPTVVITGTHDVVVPPGGGDAGHGDPRRPAGVGGAASGTSCPATPKGRRRRRAAGGGGGPRRAGGGHRRLSVRPRDRPTPPVPSRA